ncbi:MAG: glycosyltransferase family 9 protein [Bacteroidota bacterium]
MKIKTIRWIDLNVGKMLCFLLTLWRSLMRLILPSKPPPPQRILFIKFIEQGASVLAYSAIQRAIEQVGAQNVYFCLFRPNRPILDIMDLLPSENILEIRDDRLLHFFSDSAKALWRCRHLKIDSTIDMELFSRASAIFAYLSGARNRVGLHRYTSELAYRGRLMTHEIQYNPYLHIATAYLLLVESLFLPTTQVPMSKLDPTTLQTEVPKFRYKAADLEAFGQKLKREAGRPLASQLVLLNPNASDMLPLRKWETERFIHLGKQLLERHDDLLIVITGAPSEAEIADQIAARYDSPRVFSMAGRTSMRELFLLYEWSDLLVTNDSGPAHFASMTDTSIIVLFGPETPQLYGPLGSRVRVIWKALTCSPCVNAVNHRFSPCTNNVCMQGIEVDEVLTICEEELKRS